MNILIDIPYQLYKVLKDFKDFPNDSNETTIENVLMKAIKNGTPIPDNATDGQVIQTLFKPNRVERTDDDVIVEHYDFSEEWWNTPYQKGGKDDERTVKRI